MSRLIDIALSHTKTMLALLVLVFIGGINAFNAIPKEANPDVPIPTIYVSLILKGISPEDAERLLIRPVEDRIRSIEGIKDIRSTGFLGGGNILIEFDAGFDSDKALQDVRNKVDEARAELPQEIEEPVVNEVNVSLFPVLTVFLSGPVPERTLLKKARDLEEALERLENVLRVDISGDRLEQVEMVVDPVRLQSYSITAEDLVTIDENNRLVAAGSLESKGGKFEIKVPGLIETAVQLLNMPLRANNDAVVRIKDVADIHPTFEDPLARARLNGNRAMALEIVKRTGRNVIETVKQVKKTVEQESKNWPSIIKINYSGDQSQTIRDMLSDLQNNLISAVLLVMIVIIIALGLKSAGLVGIAIPGSFLLGILVLYLFGLTMNIVVLFSLILVSGMLIDGAIIVVEYANRQMDQQRLSPKQAFGLAAKRMAPPITASTLTTIAAFTPLLFWTGTTGEFMKFIPITVITTLIASLSMSLLFIPTIGTILIQKHGVQPQLNGPGDIDTIPEHGAIGLYAKTLNWALGHPGKIVASAITLLIAVQIIYAIAGKGIEFFPDIEPDQILISIQGRGNLSLDEQDDLVKPVEDIILQMNDDHQDADAIYTVIGQLSREGGRGDISEDTIGTIQIDLKPWEQRRKANEIMAEIREKTKDIPGIKVTVEKEKMGPYVGKPIVIEISSKDQKVLTETVERISQHMKAMPGLKDVEDNRPLPGIEWKLEIDRAQAAKFGVNVELLGGFAQLVTQGVIFSTFRPDDAREEVDIVARYPKEYRTLKALDELMIPTSNGNIPISEFVKRVARPKLNAVHRINGIRSLTIKSDVEPGVLSSIKLEELQAWLKKHPQSSEVKINFRGEDEEQKKSEDFLSVAFIIALGLIFVILLSEFNSFYDTFLVLTAVIMSTIGVFLGLLIMGQPFGIIMGGIGVIALAGVVVNNNIVLIDTYNTLKRSYSDAKTAILFTGLQRLRPVFLTTITTILGLIPLVLQMNIDFVERHISIGAPSTQFWVQIATCISFGLAFATILTLIVTPCALMLQANFSKWYQSTKPRND